MRTLETNVYKFNELSDSAKENAREWYRLDLDYDYGYDYGYDYIIDDAKEIAALFGLHIDEVFYSGFWSQGDGASFTGTYSFKKGGIDALCQHLGIKKDSNHEFLRIAKELQKAESKNFYKVSVEISQRGIYVHSNTMYYEFEHQDDSMYSCRDIVNEDDFEQAFKDFADYIYKSLEQAYDYMNSDEVVDENIIANEYEFDENGNFVA